MSRLLALFLLLAAPAGAAEKLRFEVRLFGVEVGEIEVDISAERISLRGESAGALVLFFPAEEHITVRLRDGRPVEVLRRFAHPGRKGEWRATFAAGAVRLEQRVGQKVKRRKLRLPAPVYDPVSALEKLRREAPEKASVLLFGGDGVYRFHARRVGDKPVRYRGRFERLRRYSARRRKPGRMPAWLRALGLGRGATKRPELDLSLSDDGRRLPLRIRLSDPRGSLEIVLKDPA